MKQAKSVPVAILLAGAAAGVLASAARAGTPVVPQSSLNAAVIPIQASPAVIPINLNDAVIPLVTQQQNGGSTTVTMNADVLFAFGKYSLSPAAERILSGIAAKLSGASGTITVDGYTDSIGTAAFNLALSRERAEAVRNALVADGVHAHIVANGYGEADPVAANTVNGQDNPAGRAQNRRVTITFAS